MGDTVYRIRKPAVVSETIDGEVVVIHLTHGCYYSMDGTAAQIWDGIEHGRSLATIQARLVATYDGAQEQIRRAVAEFVDRLAEEELVQAADDGAPAAHGSTGPVSPSGAGKRRFEPPVLHRYTDMQDLLLLDPIHDVNEMGWPAPKTS